MANVEHQLMFMYDSDVTRHLVNELIVNQGKPPQYVMQLNEKVATSISDHLQLSLELLLSRVFTAYKTHFFTTSFNPNVLGPYSWTYLRYRTKKNEKSISCVESTIIFKTCYVLWFCCYSVPKFSLSFSYGAFLMGALGLFL